MGTKATTVNVIGGNPSIESMFLDEGYCVTSSPNSVCDFVCFTGGEDVTPFLYGEKLLTIDGKVKTFCNPDRDMREIKAFHKYMTIPKVGICRGGQLLNVLSGGSMWQHVDGHLGNHQMTYVKEVKTEKNRSKRIYDTVEVTSTHHQMMRAGDQGDVIGCAGKATFKYNDENKFNFPNNKNTMLDNEVIYYWHTQSLCFQPHPEYVKKDDALRRVFFDMLKTWLNVTPLTKEST